MSSRLALLLALLACTGCRKTEPSPEPAPPDAAAGLLDSATAVDSSLAPDSTSGEALTPPSTPSFESLVQALPPELRDSVRLWRTRMDSLRAAWERDMAAALPLKNFVKRPYSHPPPLPPLDRKILAQLFQELDGCVGDSVFDIYRPGGDVESEYGSFVLAPGFTLTGGIHQGMSSTEAIQALGNPYRSGDGYLSWAVQDWGEKEHGNRVAWFENVRFFFLDDRLVAVWIVHPNYGC